MTLSSQIYMGTYASRFWYEGQVVVGPPMRMVPDVAGFPFGTVWEQFPNPGLVADEIHWPEIRILPGNYRFILQIGKSAVGGRFSMFLNDNDAFIVGFDLFDAVTQPLELNLPNVKVIDPINTLRCVTTGIGFIAGTRFSFTRNE